jgi:protein-S-isoprenylcysteine O-methyltransferase Ste14
MSRIARVFLLVFAPAMAILLALLGLKTLPANPLGWFLLLVGAAYVAGVFIAYYVQKKRFWESRADGKLMQEERGDRSFWAISAGMFVSFYLPPIEYIYFDAVIPRIVWIAYSGVGSVILGIALFVWARRTLGKNYSGHMAVKEDQELVKSGPYRVLRHPAYSGYFLMALGIAIGYSSILGVIAILVLLLPSMIYRMNVEEKLLSQHFGKAYCDYTQHTKRMIPGIW